MAYVSAGSSAARMDAVTAERWAGSSAASKAGKMAAQSEATMAASMAVR